MAANASVKRCARRLVDPLDRLAGLRDRVDQILALRRQERVARLELVELLDRHHVDRPEPLDLARAASAIASSALSAALRCDRRRPTDGACASALSAVAVDRLRRRPRRPRRRRSRARPASRARLRSSSLDLGQHLVERRLHGVDARSARGASGRFRRWRARCRARRPSRGSLRASPRAILMAASCSSAPVAQRCDTRRRPSRRRRAGRRARERRRRAAPRRAIDRRAQRPRRAGRVSSQLGRQRRGARFELAAGFLEPLRLRRRAPRRARPAPACAAPASAARRLSVLGRFARLEQPALRVGQPLVGRALLARRAARSTRALRPAAARARRAPLRPAGARARAARPSARDASASSAARCSCAS